MKLKGALQELIALFITPVRKEEEEKRSCYKVERELTYSDLVILVTYSS